MSKNSSIKNLIAKNRGFTLIELMIGITVGLIVMAGVTNVFVTTVASSAETLKASKLNQDLSAVMSIIVSEVRRSGYWNGVGVSPFRISVAAAGYPPSPFDNPLDLNADTANCILYAYDNSDNGTVTNSENFGFKLGATGSVGHIEMRASGTDADDCTNGTWDANVTDPNVIDITALTFTRAGSRCLNTTTDVSWNSTCNDSGATGYVAPVVDDVLVETRQVVITLDGELVNDSTVKKSMTESVKVRSNLVIEIT